MPAPRLSGFAAAAVALAFVLTGCGSGDSTADDAPAPSAVENETQNEQVDDAAAGDGDSAAGASEITIPAGAYPASPEFPFPVPDGWAILEPFEETKLGKDLVMSGGVEYPGDAKDAAAIYKDILIAAGFDAYNFAPGELTNQASLAAHGVINGEPRTAILNFDMFADQYQRVAITVSTD